MRILGLSGFYHDSAASLLDDGRIVAAAQEERFTRKKHDASFPKEAIRYCLSEGSISLADIDYVVFYDKPFLKFERLVETYLSFAPKGFQSFRMAMPLWLKEKLFQKDLLRNHLSEFDKDFSVDRLLFAEHHLSHAASAFFPSPFERAVVLTMDGVGEWATTSVSIGDQNKLEVVKEIHFPHSLGLLYSAFTYYTGFRVNSGEYKVMGLAPYGEPRFAAAIRDHLIDIKKDGSFRLDMSYFDYCTGLRMTNQKFDDLFGGPARVPEDELTQREMDLAASIQLVTEEVVLNLTRSLAKETGERNLCLAGGVALNSVANGKVQRDGGFENVWIQPAAGDAGGAVGAAMAANYLHLERPRTLPPSGRDAMRGGYLGPSFSQEEIEECLVASGANFQLLNDDALVEKTAKDLADGKAVGWFQGRMEFGPRALGARSILGDPRSPTMQSLLNLKVKFRESFRPFAPSVLAEDASSWFDFEYDSPYMLMVAGVKSEHRLPTSAEDDALFGVEKLNVLRSSIPAVTHVDYSARLQTVHRETNPRFHQLISEFKSITGCPVLVNTSFNVRGEPIVGSPADAYRCFMGTGIERLAVGNFYLCKESQDPSLLLDYTNSFDLD